MSRPTSGYHFTPGLWFATAAATATGVIEPWNEVVAEATIPEVARVTIHREGLVWFDFSGCSLDCSDAIGGDPERFVSLLNERALYMTAHSSCIAKAFFKRANTIWVGGTVVTSARQIVAGGSQPPTSTNPMLYLYCIQRWIRGQEIPYWETYGGADTSRFVLTVEDAQSSLELFAELAKSRAAMENLNLVIRSEASLRDQDFTEALVQAWTAIEMAMDALWWKMIDDKLPREVMGNRSRRRRLEDTRSYTASVRAEILNFGGFVDDDLYGKISSLRQTRNAFLHTGKTIDPSAAILAVRTAGDVLKIGIGYETPIAAGWHMRH